LGAVKNLDGCPILPSRHKRAKEQEFLLLKQGQISVTEYAAKFNELSRYASNQVATEEMKMDHFE